MPPELVSETFEVMDVDEFTELAYERQWTDGLPVLPPTEKKVLAMLDYLGRDPQEVIGIIPPGEGIATLEKLAINCVMAGCKPEYMPVVITAVQAMLEEKFELNRVQCTTSGPAALAIISGPVVKKLDFNYGEGAFAGTGHRANSTIGRAIRLILWNIGLGRPNELSHAIYSHPARYCYLVAERPRDDGNPWEEFHVTAAGLRPEDSAVSMFPVKSHDYINTGIGVQTIENALFVTADSMIPLGHFQAAEQKVLVMNPQPANYLTDHGWGKEQVRDAIAALAKRPLRDIKRTGGVSVSNKYHWTRLVPSDADDDTLVPSVPEPNRLHLLVTGGWGAPAGQCLILTAVHGQLVTKKIDWSFD